MPTRWWCCCQSRKWRRGLWREQHDRTPQAPPKRTPEGVPSQGAGTGRCTLIVFRRPSSFGGGFHGALGAVNLNINQDSAATGHVVWAWSGFKKVIKRAKNSVELLFTTVGGGIEGECAGALEW